MATFHDEFHYLDQGALEAGGWTVVTNTGWDSVTYNPTGSPADGFLDVQSEATFEGTAQFRIQRPLASPSVTYCYVHLEDGDYPSGYAAAGVGVAAMYVRFGLAQSAGTRYLYGTVLSQREYEEDGNYHVSKKYFSIVQSNGIVETSTDLVWIDVPDPDYLRLKIVGSTVTLQRNSSVDSTPDDGPTWDDVVAMTLLSATYDTFAMDIQADSRTNCWQNTQLLSTEIVTDGGSTQVTRTRSGRWNVARLNLVGTAVGSSSRFAPRPVI